MTSIDADGHLQFGIFLAPFHPVGQNPTLALERDLQLIEHLDALGFAEAWFGEHHSAGYEIIASPEVFIAAAASAHQAHPPGHRRLLAALITTPTSGPTAWCCSTTEPGTGHDPRRAGQASLRCLRRRASTRPSNAT